MYAIVEIKGKQYKVFEKSIINIEKLNLNINSLFILNKILLISDNSKIFFINKDFLKNIFITSRVIFQGKYKKVNIFKMKRRKHYKKFKNHRQFYTKIIIEKFEIKFLKNFNLNGS